MLGRWENIFETIQRYVEKIFAKSDNAGWSFSKLRQWKEMGIKHFRPYTPSRRNMTVSDFDEITKKTPEKSLLAKKKKNAGRNSYGRITVRHQGGENRQKVI